VEQSMMLYLQWQRVMAKTQGTVALFTLSRWAASQQTG